MPVTDAFGNQKPAVLRAQAKVIMARLQDLPDELLMALPYTEDETKLNEAADKILQGIKDYGAQAAAQGGPAQPQGTPVQRQIRSGLTAGQQAFADALKLPGQQQIGERSGQYL